MTEYEDLIPRFLRYVQVNTRSDEHSDTIPSSPNQTAFLKALASELEQLGLTHTKFDAASGYVTAELPSNTDLSVPTIGFIAHVDTADFNADHVSPQIHENYDGQSIIALDQAGKYVLDPAEFPNLKHYQGDTLITTDGTTLLGADDKAGVAEIISAMTYLLAHPEITHGTLKVAFGPDEEIGTGADHFDVAGFAADFAYTVDGGPLGELEYETFNAAAAHLEIQGKNVHTSTAKGVMVNALQLGIDFQNALPSEEVPEKTSGKQGFYHLMRFEGEVEQASLDYIIRDFDRAGLEARKSRMAAIASALNEQYGPRVELTLTDQYYNMIEIMKNHMDVVDLARQAMIHLGIEPDETPVRGGTDGSKLSFMGLPTPNLFAGGENMHGRYEYVSTKTMAQAVDVILQISRWNVLNHASD